MKRTLLTILVFVGVFAFGAVAGGALSIRYFNRFVEDKGANRLALTQLREVSDQLELTPEQRKKGRVIFERSMKDRQAAQKHLQVINQRLIDDLNELLTPEQREKYREWRSQQRTDERQWQRWVREQRERRGASPPTGADGKPAPLFPLLEQRRERERERERGRERERTSPPPPATPREAPATSSNSPTPTTPPATGGEGAR